MTATGDQSAYVVRPAAEPPPEASLMEGYLAQVRELADGALEKALAEPDADGNRTRIWLAQHLQEFTDKGTDGVVWWRDGYVTAEGRCPVPLHGGRGRHLRSVDGPGPRDTDGADSGASTGRHRKS